MEKINWRLSHRKNFSRDCLFNVLNMFSKDMRNRFFGLIVSIFEYWRTLFQLSIEVEAAIISVVNSLMNIEL